MIFLISSMTVSSCSCRPTAVLICWALDQKPAQTGESFLAGFCTRPQAAGRSEASICKIPLLCCWYWLCLGDAGHRRVPPVGKPSRTKCVRYKDYDIFVKQIAVKAYFCHQRNRGGYDAGRATWKSYGRQGTEESVRRSRQGSAEATEVDAEGACCEDRRPFFAAQ